MPLNRDLNTELGRRLRRRRRQLGLSQSSLAALVGVTFQQIHKYECGACTLYGGRLWDLANALEAPITYFYEGFPLIAKPNEDAKDAPDRPGAMTASAPFVAALADLGERLQAP